MKPTVLGLALVTMTSGSIRVPITGGAPVRRQVRIDRASEVGVQVSPQLTGQRVNG